MKVYNTVYILIIILLYRFDGCDSSCDGCDVYVMDSNSNDGILYSLLQSQHKFKG